MRAKKAGTSGHQYALARHRFCLLALQLDVTSSICGAVKIYVPSMTRTQPDLCLWILPCPKVLPSESPGRAVARNGAKNHARGKAPKQSAGSGVRSSFMTWC